MSGRTILTLGSANIEQVQDTVGAMFQNAAGITWTYNDAAGTITPATDHGGIGGLADDDHTQYAFLGGRSGGQILYGSTAASENLRLEGTVHATPGTVYTSASSFGVGGIPTAKMHVFAGATAGGGLQVDGTSSPKLRVSDTGSSVHNIVQVDGAAAYAGSGSNHPYVLRVNDTEAARFNTSRSFGIGTGTTVDRRFHVEEDSATTNAVTYVGRFTSTSSGTPANGIGVGLEFEVETSAGNNEIGATIETIAIDTTSTSEDFDLVGKVMVAGAAATTCFRFGAFHTSLGGSHITALPSTAGAFPQVFFRPHLGIVNTGGGSVTEAVAYNSFLDTGGSSRAVFTGVGIKQFFSAASAAMIISTAPSVTAGSVQTFTNRYTFPVAGRQWASVTGSRAIGTIYQNTTGGEIYVSVTVGLDATGTALLEVGTASPPTIEVGRTKTGAASTFDQLFACVPNNAFYRVSQSAATVTLTAWSEMS